MQTDLPVAGFALLEAASREEALKRVAGTARAIARGVVEVWPLRSALDQD
jgi:hypothetical protein